MKPLQPSTELAVIVGSSPLPRTEVVSKIWEYMTASHLRRKDKVSMFEMNKHLAQHLS
jgi:chromatin remodeling complex protein RSC6